MDVEEKISKVKYPFEQLGEIQDKLSGLLEGDDDEFEKSYESYQGYDRKVNFEINTART